MRTLTRLFGLLLLGLLGGLLLLTATSCETTRTRERAAPEATTIRRGDVPGAPASSRAVMQLDENQRPELQIPQNLLAQALTRQFADGSVIDRVQVRRAPAAGSPVYYLIGTGLYNGNYRAIALPLRSSPDGQYFLDPGGRCYVLRGSGCPTCFFDFEGTEIVGGTCDENSGGSYCEFSETTADKLFSPPAANEPRRQMGPAPDPDRPGRAASQ